MENKTVTLDQAIQRGDTTITEIQLRKPKAGEMRGLNMTDVVQMDVNALTKLLPRITTPILTEAEIGNMDPPVEPMEAPYHVMNSIQCFALVGNDKIPVEIDGLSIKYLIESFAWEISGTIYGRTAANYLRPTADGPAHLEVIINGWTWLTAVKRYTRSNKFPSESYQFTALSRSGLLERGG